MLPTSGVPDTAARPAKGSRGLKAGFKSLFVGSKSSKRVVRPCGAHEPNENQTYSTLGNQQSQIMDLQIPGRCMSPVHPLRNSNSPGPQSNSHGATQSMSRVSLTELQSALGLKIPAALTLQSSPSSPTTGPHAKATPAANSKQASREWPDNKGGALPGSMSADTVVTISQPRTWRLQRLPANLVQVLSWHLPVSLLGASPRALNLNSCSKTCDQAGGRLAAADSATGPHRTEPRSSRFARPSNKNSAASCTSDAGLSITSEIVAQIMQEQAGSVLLTQSLDACISGKDALQQEGWRAPKAKKRPPKADSSPGRNTLRKRSPRQQLPTSHVTDAPSSPGHVDPPRKRQNRFDTAPPITSFQEEVWPMRQPGATVTAAPAAAAGSANTGPNDKMKDIMSFLDAVEAQIEAQPTLALGTQKGRVAREALAEITRSQLPPQLAPQPLPQLPPAAARIHSWVQDAAQGDTSSEAGSQKSGMSLASQGASSTHLASSVFQAVARQQDLLEQQRREYESTIARHLQFVDRLLQDKDDLSARCAALAADVKAREKQLATQAGSLRDGWALELKRHKEAWAVGEKSRKEAWQASKMREIKEMTIKGLEPDIEQMRRQHKDDLRHATQQAQEMAKLQVEEKDQEWEKRMRQARQQSLLDLDDAVRKERVAGQARIQEVIERYEAQLQMQRMRLASDKDCAQEQVQAALAEEHKAHRAALDRLEQERAQSEEKLRQQLAEEREQLQRTCDRRLSQLRQEHDSTQAGFRAAVAERAKRELATREKAMRERLITERDKELQFVMERLEEVQQAAAADSSEDLQQQLEQLEKRAARRDSELRQAQQSQAEATAALIASLQSKLGAATAQAEAVRARGAMEMLQVEHRVRGTVARKDEAIAALQDQLSGTMHELQSLQAALNEQ
ncbi:hypothetical protein WJX84_005247 [Apatococcus fuscideae]|uniref:Centrosomal protein of 131 kDa n=1 Tax=Apatococcus fuscideae TaxID=2026836 RepID=A0AAW1SSK2_9CHLO